MPSSTIRTFAPWASSAPRRSRSTSGERAAATGKCAQCFGGAKNHAIIMPDADMDQTRRCADRRGVRLAPASAAWRFRSPCRSARPPPDKLIEKLIPRVENLKIGPSTDPTADYGPLGDQGRARAGQGLRRYRHQGGRQARGRRPRLQDAGL